MFIKLFHLFFVIIIIFQFPVYSKNSDKNGFYYKELSSYFSAQVSYVNQNNKEALKFFKLLLMGYLYLEKIQAQLLSRVEFFHKKLLPFFD